MSPATNLPAAMLSGEDQHGLRKKDRLMDALLAVLVLEPALPATNDQDRIAIPRLKEEKDQRSA